MNRSFFVGNFKSKKRKRETEQSSVSLQESVLPLEQSQAGGPSFKKSKRETLCSRLQSDPTSKEYLAWKENIIRNARSKLVAES